MRQINLFYIYVIVLGVLCLIGGWLTFYKRIKKHIEKHQSEIPIETEGNKNDGTLWKGILIGVIVIIVILAVRELVSWLLGMGSLMLFWNDLYSLVD